MKGSQNSVEVTVALPTWDNKDIIWLQLESLCRQETEYAWELIVCEEQTKNMLGKDALLIYEQRLQERGCKAIRYIPLKKHTPLSLKWVIIAKASLGKTFCFCASDNYSPPTRIQLSHEKINEGYNWFDVKKSLFLNLKSFSCATYVNQKKEKNSGVFIATRTELIKGLNGPPWPKSGIDNWIKTKCRTDPSFQFQNNLLGLHTDGANKISSDRKNHYPNNKTRKRYIPPFFPPEQSLDEILPQEIKNRLHDLFFAPFN